MRVMSWNLGKRSRHSRAVLDHLQHLGADIALLQESRIHALAKNEGWQVVSAAESPSDCVILAKNGLDVRRAQPSAVSQLGRYLAHAELHHGESMTHIFSVHPLAEVVPLRALTHLQPIDVQRNSDPRVWWSDLFYYLIEHTIADDSAIVGGDWNTSRLFQESLFDRAAALGWVEALPAIHGEQQRTWFRGTDKPHGLDHVFCTADLKTALTGAFVDATVADSAGEHVGQGLSDHAPVIVDLDLPSDAA